MTTRVDGHAHNQGMRAWTCRFHVFVGVLAALIGFGYTGCQGTRLASSQIALVRNTLQTGETVEAALSSLEAANVEHGVGRARAEHESLLRNHGVPDGEYEVVRVIVRDYKSSFVVSSSKCWMAIIKDGKIERVIEEDVHTGP